MCLSQSWVFEKGQDAPIKVPQVCWGSLSAGSPESTCHVPVWGVWSKTTPWRWNVQWALKASRSQPDQKETENPKLRKCNGPRNTAWRQQLQMVWNGWSRGFEVEKGKGGGWRGGRRGPEWQRQPGLWLGSPHSTALEHEQGAAGQERSRSTLFTL